MFAFICKRSEYGINGDYEVSVLTQPLKVIFKVRAPASQVVERGAESRRVVEGLRKSSTLQTTQERQRAMKKLLLIALAMGGSAFVAAQRSDAQTTVLVSRTERLSFGFPSGYYGSPSYLNYYPYGYYRHPYVHLLSVCRESIFILFRTSKL